MSRQLRIAVLLLWMGLSSRSWGQATQPAIPMGRPFRSLAAGISVTPPAGTNVIRGAVGSSEVVRFVDEKRKWVLKVSRVILEPDKPLPLTAFTDRNGRRFPGMLELTADQFLQDVPGAQELRRDTTVIHDREIGMQAARFSYGLETNLTQQAVIPTSKTNQIQYYVIAMTSPVPREGPMEDDPGAREAVATFTSVLDSVQILDQTEIRIDRDDRLLQTQLMYLNLTEAKLRGALKGGQWLRVLRDGKDVGYTYVVEEIARDLPRKGRLDQQTGPEGVLIGMRSMMRGDDGGRIDSESWSFSTFDRKYEAFSTTIYTDSPRTGKSISGDIGFSRSRMRPVAIAPGQALDGRAKVEEGVEYKLEVNRLGRNITPEPIVRDLPPFYLPQALHHLLPRLIDLRTADEYLFASWVPEAGQIMYRYIDVLSEQDVNLNGRRVRAIPIEDRVGLEGSITTHYVTHDREYLGSINPDTRTTIVTSDAATLQRLWRDANLTRPGEVER